MKDKDKLWIVAYISVKGMCKSRAYQLLAEFRNHYKFDDSVNLIIVPVEEPTHIEFYKHHTPYIKPPKCIINILYIFKQ